MHRRAWHAAPFLLLVLLAPPAQAQIAAPSDPRSFTWQEPGVLAVGGGGLTKEQVDWLHSQGFRASRTSARVIVAPPEPAPSSTTPKGMVVAAEEPEGAAPPAPMPMPTADAPPTAETPALPPEHAPAGNPPALPWRPVALGLALLVGAAGVWALARRPRVA